MYRTDFRTLWEKARVGCLERTASKHIYYQGWNRSPVQVGCMRQVLRAGALGRPRGMGWRGRQEGGSGLGTHVNPWLIHVNVWQKPLQYCKVISLQQIKINGEKKRKIFLCWDLSDFYPIVRLRLYLLRKRPQRWGLPRGHQGKESMCQCRRHKRHGFHPWVRKIPCSRKWQLSPVFLPG